MINDDDEFIETIAQKKFIGNISCQENMVLFVFKNMDVDKLKILWQVQELYDVNYSHHLLEPAYLEHASIDDLLVGLRVFLYKPTSFVQRVLDEGNHEQIEQLNNILKSLIHEHLT